MPSYSFKERFVPFVKDGSKKHTIRGIRKNLPRVGQIVSHFTGSRFKPVRIIEKSRLEMIENIFILENGDVWLWKTSIGINKTAANYMIASFLIDGADSSLKRLDQNAKDLLAWKDGFRHFDEISYTMQPEGCFEMMFEFFKTMHDLPFAGHIIHWK